MSSSFIAAATQRAFDAASHRTSATLSMDDIHRIQSECMADDLEVDYDAMRHWSEKRLRDWFEQGGGRAPAEAATRAYMACAGACVPNAPIPDVPPCDDTTNRGGKGCTRALQDAPPAADAGRIFGVSDLHCDHAANMAWCRGLRERGGFERDVFIVAGDVSNSIVILRDALETLVATFKAVFYVPGNHDLWTKSASLPGGGVHIRPMPITSEQKLEEVLALCKELQVYTTAAYVGGAIVAPVLAWYHASWDTEPEIKGWKGIVSHEMLMSDFRCCKWPSPLSALDDSLARYFDEMNESNWRGANKRHLEALRAAHPGAPLITFSHFVPRIELTPEKRYLYFPNLLKASGSDPLARRVESLQPHIHVFGHTHFGWDETLDGIRYIQVCHIRKLGPY